MEPFLRRFNRALPRLTFVLMVGVIALVATTASAEKRILLVGDSWTEFPWKDGAFQAVLDFNYGPNVYEVEGTYTAIGGTTSGYSRTVSSRNDSMPSATSMRLSTVANTGRFTERSDNHIVLHSRREYDGP